MTSTWKTLVVVGPLALAAACTDGAKAPAEAAMAAAGAAVDTLKGDAAKYAPDEVKKARDLYDVGKTSMADKDYAGALRYVKDVPAMAKDALAKSAAAKAALEKSWKEAGETLARSVEAAKHRLSGSSKPPPGMDKAAVARAHAELSTIEAGWTAAKDQYGSGDWSGAVARARDLSAKGQELLASLGVK